jgi:predicted 2-oxoglutarate/Fe(II)-dependent dioxygenase YbiX/peroxiredoxin
MVQFRVLQRGDPAPWFRGRSSTNPRFAFDIVAGRNIVLCFVQSSVDAAVQRLLAAAQNAPVFDDARASYFVVSRDPDDENLKRLAPKLPGKRVLWDPDAAISRAYGAVADDDADAWRRLWVVLDPTLRVIEATPFNATTDPEELLARVAALPPAGAQNAWPPVLSLPHVLEPELCALLIARHKKDGGFVSGFMAEQDGKTVMMHDQAHKRRRDVIIEELELMKTLQGRVHRRIVPEVAKAFQFKCTRMERYLVGCYTAEDGGHFRPHRDNTTSGTAHRRFAVTINLNADFEGGELSFPEFGPRRFKPSPGGAMVFSCSLLHMVHPVTKGARYAFLPFLYDEAAAQTREENNQNLGDGVDEYAKD